MNDKKFELTDEASKEAIKKINESKIEFRNMLIGEILIQLRNNHNIDISNKDWQKKFIFNLKSDLDKDKANYFFQFC